MHASNGMPSVEYNANKHKVQISILPPKSYWLQIIAKLFYPTYRYMFLNIIAHFHPKNPVTMVTKSQKLRYFKIEIQPILSCIICQMWTLMMKETNIKLSTV